MIDIAGLMLNNWVFDTKNERRVKVHGIDPTWNFIWVNYANGGGQYKLSPNEIEGIELTPELLVEKCRFVSHTHESENKESALQGYRLNETILYRVHESARSDIWFYEMETGSTFENRTPIPCKIFHLHQLQNLIFALTGNQLEVKI